MLTETDIDALVVAVLAVGAWPAARVRDALPLLRSAALLSPGDVAAMDLGEVTVKLAKNDYSRGLLTSMYGERLQAVMRAVVAGTLDVLPELVRSGQQDAFTRTLTEIHGVGPKVAANAWEFLSAVQRETTPSKDQPGAD